LVSFIEQPLRHAPECEVYGLALLRIIERRKRLGFPEHLAVLIVNPKIERVLRHYPQHHAVAEHAGFAEHAPQGDTAEWRELLAQKLGIGFAGNHLSSRLGSNSVAPLAAA